MNPRLHLTGEKVLLWTLPSLDEPRLNSDASLVPIGTQISVSEPDQSEDALVVAPEVTGPFAELPVPEEIAMPAAEGYADGLQRGLEQGHAEGYAAGLEAGMQAGSAQLAAQARSLAEILARLAAPITVLDRRVEEAVVALALEVARCVIGSEVSRSRDYLVRLIREAIAKVPIEMGAPSVLLNPADLAAIGPLTAEIEGAGIVLVADESIEAGGCIVIANGDDMPIKDRRWHPRSTEGVSQVNLTLASRWRSVMLSLFDGEE